MQSMHVMILSPHRDDAAFSCGLLTLSLLAAGATITVVNVFTVSDYAPYLEAAPNRVQQVTLVRAAEDKEYLKQLAARGDGVGSIALIDLHWQDAPLRLSIQCEQVLTSVEQDAITVERLLADFKSLPDANCVLAPLALGNHLDHTLVRDAAKRAFAGRLLFYQDLPYACRLHPAEGEALVTSLLPHGSIAWSPAAEGRGDCKYGLAMAYPSQISSDTAAEMEAYVVQHGNTETFYGYADVARQLQNALTKGTSSDEHVGVHGAGQSGTSSSPDVSVLMTVYNTAQYLEEAICSVLSQQASCTWELIVVDDGSSDNSLSIALQYASWYPGCIQVWQHPNGRNLGISASRNLALRHAAGAVIGFLDSDDVWLPYHLATLFEVLRQTPQAAAVYGNAERWVDFSKSFDCERSAQAWWGQNYLPPLVPAGESHGLLAPGTLLKWFLQDESKVPCICSMLVRRSAVQAVHGFVNEFRGLYDDQAFHAKLSLQFSIVAHDVCVARYRQHAASCRARADDDQSARDTEQARFLSFVQEYSPSA